MNYSFYSDTGEKNAAYALLRYAFENVYGTALPPIEKTENGKPFFPSRQDIFFSLSHSKKHVLVTFGDIPCGCDIEDDRAYRPETALRTCAETELALFEFLDLWTLKESYMKLKGNFKKQIRDICFSKDGDAIIAPEKNLYSHLSDISGLHLAIICEGEAPNLPFFIPSSQLIS